MRTASFENKMPSMLAVSAGIHLVILFLFAFTFPLPEFSPRPYFVFLGSFLSDHDMVSVARLDGNHPNVFEKQKFNLDIRKDYPVRQLAKPDLTSAFKSQNKIQFKPVMDKDNGVVKYKDTLEGLGIELAPFKPVRMKLDRDDQN